MKAKRYIMTKEEFIEKLKTKEIDNRRFSIQKRAPDISIKIENFLVKTLVIRLTIL